jgi:hypothetical protein
MKNISTLEEVSILTRRREEEEEGGGRRRRRRGSTKSYQKFKTSTLG